MPLQLTTRVPSTLSASRDLFELRLQKRLAVRHFSNHACLYTSCFLYLSLSSESSVWPGSLRSRIQKLGRRAEGSVRDQTRGTAGSLWNEGLVRPLGVESIKRVIEASQLRIIRHSPSAVARPSRCFRLARIMHTESAGSGGK